MDVLMRGRHTERKTSWYYNTPAVTYLGAVGAVRGERVLLQILQKGRREAGHVEQKGAVDDHT